MTDSGPKRGRGRKEKKVTANVHKKKKEKTKTKTNKKTKNEGDYQRRSDGSFSGHKTETLKISYLNQLSTAFSLVQESHNHAQLETEE